MGFDWEGYWYDWGRLQETCKGIGTDFQMNSLPQKSSFPTSYIFDVIQFHGTLLTSSSAHSNFFLIFKLEISCQFWVSFGGLNLWNHTQNQTLFWSSWCGPPKIRGKSIISILMLAQCIHMYATWSNSSPRLFSRVHWPSFQFAVLYEPTSSNNSHSNFQRSS